MITVRWTSPPICKTCGKPLKEWDMFTDPYNSEHVECAAKRIADEMMESVKKDLNKSIK